MPHAIAPSGGELPVPLPPGSVWEPHDLVAWLRLTLTPCIGNTSARRLLARCSSAAAIFAADAHTLGQCVSASQVAQLQQLPPHFLRQLTRTLQWMDSGTPSVVHDLISLGDARYPNSLLHTADPPLLLYAIGARAVLQRRAPLHDWQRSIAIVGSRNPTPQGASHAQTFAHDLVQAGWCIVSGMALGVDAAAHHGALQLESAAAPCTIAVVGTGLDIIYPRQHALLAQSIAQRGLLLSEFPLGTPPIASNFPKRNRIISGLSRGTLVVEAALASGSLITARTASEQGREVFAIPGSIHSPQSRGCHALIRQGAKLVECTQDILEEWSTTPTVAAHADGTAVQASNEALPAADADTPLLRALGYDPVDLDTLSARSGMGAGDLQAQLLELELQGQVTRLPGGWFQRHSRA